MDLEPGTTEGCTGVHATEWHIESVLLVAAMAQGRHSRYLQYVHDLISLEHCVRGLCRADYCYCGCQAVANAAGGGSGR